MERHDDPRGAGTRVDLPVGAGLDLAADACWMPAMAAALIVAAGGRAGASDGGASAMPFRKSAPIRDTCGRAGDGGAGLLFAGAGRACSGAAFGVGGAGLAWVPALAVPAWAGPVSTLWRGAGDLLGLGAGCGTGLTSGTGPAAACGGAAARA